MKIEITNLDELKNELKKATQLCEELSGSLKNIKQFELKIRTRVD